MGFISQRIFNGHVAACLVDGRFTVGATGAVTSGTVKGPYVTSVTRLGVGLYKIITTQNFTELYDFNYTMSPAVTGSNILVSTGPTIGIGYQITAVGTSTQANWETIGLTAGLPAAVGVGFVGIATAAGTGNGTFKAVVQSGVTAVEVLGVPNLSVNRYTTVGAGGTGAAPIVVCYGPTASGDTTPIPTDPVSGTIFRFRFLFSNSSVQINGT